MMKFKYLICLILLLSCFPLLAQKKGNEQVRMPVYPSFNEVSGYFFKYYSFPEAKEYTKYSFAKKPDGWHILLTDYYTGRVLSDYYLWDRKSGKYNTLYFPQADAKKAEVPEEFRTWENQYFNRISPYYGYVGWDADVIRDYGSLSNLSDTVLNALARAYASFAFNLLGNRGFADPEKQFKLKSGLNSLTEQQLGMYRHYQNMAIDCYFRLMKQNPRFENFVGDIFTVYSNEVMNSFLTLRYYQNEEEALRELKPDLYDPFFISIAKNYLASCDSNAILFTNGDSDTFPLLYVQEQYGFRRDVLVVNVSLLQSPHYLNHLFNKIGQAEPLHLSIDHSKYRDGLVQYAYVINRMGSEYADLRDLMKFVDSSDTATKFRHEQDYLTYIPTTNFKYRVDRQKMLMAGIVDPGDYEKVDSVMRWNIKNRHVLYQNDIAMLDILASSGHSRPIYIASTVSDEYYLELFSYLQFEGYAYKIVPVKYEYEDDQYGRIKPEVLYDKLVNSFDYADISRDHVYLSEGHHRMISNIKIQFARLASALIQENKRDSSLRVLLFFESKFPSERIANDYYSIEIARCYYAAGRSDMGSNLVKQIAEFYSSGLTKLKKQKKNLSDEQNNEVQISLAAFRELKSLTDDYRQIELNKEISHLFQKYRKEFGY